MAEHHAIRGTRAGVSGGGPFGELRDGPWAPRRPVSYWCAQGHHTQLELAVSAEVPGLWDCRCGLAAGQDQTQPPEPVGERPFKTHFDYVQDRRTDAEGETLLAEALARLRAQRDS
ncbi:RNA polymerase-binding protein RbpA [Pseudonocardia acidicola]|uniref:RNA polymerase-binding protein RbpA n=1 Tax=Pseudonocardia acidicola TaxID=2724939 RepID=A0ABX1SMJ7_9PSEU|nr:RNA polymerase-binding protein RbpA [Pseudonocardia acidicola]NMI01354.1 RNA polymerase-binding protein RbpA [Pseudonocardia acidicola]